MKLWDTNKTWDKVNKMKLRDRNEIRGKVKGSN